MAEGVVRLEIQGRVASVVFDRPESRNAMTWPMYEQLVAICRRLQTDSSVRVVTFRGAGGAAFVAGTDIEQFKGFRTGDDGVAYERQIEDCISVLEGLPMPTVALIEGWAVGGGLAIATTCDFRIATPEAKLGVPIARTLGNCLSVGNTARLVAAFGPQRVKRMLMLAEMLTAQEAFACGYLHEIAEPAAMDAVAASLVERLSLLAPVTQAISKETLKRLATDALPQGDDLVRRSYGSADFREGVDAFVSKRSPIWKGC